ncbi:hypothetical protein AVEN_260787-1 [Araneus ventricosus]|uniref:Uncharacterized protein n=1 Tax=Araneus ventricosus TaxID=182803 RepID=A0A4Y2VIA1_ARAVE|nr:hypothetical protein AVEN_260787-1 [Araneus ventricosus]
MIRNEEARHHYEAAETENALKLNSSYQNLYQNIFSDRRCWATWQMAWDERWEACVAHNIIPKASLTNQLTRNKVYFSSRTIAFPRFSSKDSTPLLKPLLFLWGIVQFNPLCLVCLLTTSSSYHMAPPSQQISSANMVPEEATIQRQERKTHNSAPLSKEKPVFSVQIPLIFFVPSNSLPAESNGWITECI